MAQRFERKGALFAIVIIFDELKLRVLNFAKIEGIAIWTHFSFAFAIHLGGVRITPFSCLIYNSLAPKFGV